MANTPPVDQRDGDAAAVSQSHHHYQIEKWQPNSDCLKSMHQKLTTPPKLLSPTAGHTSCCIFRAPTTLAGINGKSYQPHIVSVGPYHRGNPHLAMIQEHKWRYLSSLLARIPSLTLESLLSSIAPLESRIRACYSEQIDINRDEFLESMVLDGCFIVELFRKKAGVVAVEQHDPIFVISWIMPFFYRDLLRLENQIPFLVLERLFDLTQEEKETSTTLSALALGFFNHSMQRSKEIIDKCKDLKAKHLLDLIRCSYTQFDPPVPCSASAPPVPRSASAPPVPRSAGAPPVRMIPNISKLRKAGIKLRRVEPAAAGDEGNPLLVRFQHGVLEMPGITIDDFMCSFLTNVVAYEQCYGGAGEMRFTAYATLLDSLVNGYRDVEYLCAQDIMENYMGTESDVAKFFNGLGKEVAFDIDKCYLAKMFSDVRQYYGNSWNVHLASFKFTYFQTPWSFISALAAFVLLVLTLLQTVYTIYSVYN